MSQLTLSFKDKVLKGFPLPEGEEVIGSDPSCSIHIDSLAIHPRHAVIITRGEESIIRDLQTPEGTYVNNERITEQELKDGDVIRVGKHTLSFTQEQIVPAMAETEAEPPLPDTGDLSLEPIKPPENAWLQIMTGQNLGKTIRLSKRMTNLGAPGVQTAVVVKRNDGYFLSHLEGEHPPEVGDKSIGNHSHRLQDGDIIRIGNVKMQFILE